jgi:hypothetical protein
MKNIYKIIIIISILFWQINNSISQKLENPYYNKQIQTITLKIDG